jgi:hypothetical protein
MEIAQAMDVLLGMVLEARCLKFFQEAAKWASRFLKHLEN